MNIININSVKEIEHPIYEAVVLTDTLGTIPLGIDINNVEVELPYMVELASFIQNNPDQVVVLDAATKLAKAKETKLTEILAAYEVDNILDIVYNGTTFQADPSSQSMMASVLAVGSVPANFYWLSSSNVRVAMTFTELQGLGEVILTRSQLNFEKKVSLKEDVAAATTIAEVEAIVW